MSASNDGDGGGSIVDLEGRVTEIVAGFIVGGILTLAEVPIDLMLILRREILAVLGAFEAPFVSIFDAIRQWPFAIVEVLETGSQGLAASAGVLAPVAVALYWGALTIALVWSVWMILRLLWLVVRIL